MTRQEHAADVAPPNSNGRDANTPPFTSILVARTKRIPPSELEVMLRAHSVKMKVNTYLSGAHMILQAKNSSSIALRVYYSIHLQEQEAYQAHTSEAHLRTHTSGLDGVEEFVAHFQWTVIFFILPPELFVKYMNEKDSFLRRVVRLSGVATADPQQSAPSKPRASKNPPRVVFLTSTQEAISYLMLMSDALQPAKHQLRNRFFQKQQQRSFVPTSADDMRLQNHAGTHAVTVLREMANRFQLPPGEIDLLLRVIGKSITVSSLSSADFSQLPVDDRTKTVLNMIFSRNPVSTAQFHGLEEHTPAVEDNNIMAMSNSMREFDPPRVPFQPSHQRLQDSAVYAPPQAQWRQPPPQASFVGAHAPPTYQVHPDQLAPWESRPIPPGMDPSGNIPPSQQNFYPPASNYNPAYHWQPRYPHQQQPQELPQSSVRRVQQPLQHPMMTQAPMQRRYPAFM